MDGYLLPRSHRPVRQNLRQFLQLLRYLRQLRHSESIRCAFNGTFDKVECARIVLATIGVFSIVQLVRNVQILIPAYDFCIPEKECVNTADNPCELFSRIDFPTDEFFPPKLESEDGMPCKT